MFAKLCKTSGQCLRNHHLKNAFQSSSHFLVNIKQQNISPNSPSIRFGFGARLTNGFVADTSMRLELRSQRCEILTLLPLVLLQLAQGGTLDGSHP